MKFEKKHDTSLYTLINYKNNIERLYHDLNDIKIKCNEFCIYLDVLIPEGYYFYIIYNKPIHGKTFSQQDLNFLNMDIEAINKLEFEPNHSKTIEFFKNAKIELLLFLENIKNLYFYFFIPRLEANNEFNYDLLLLFKNDHNISDVSNYISNIVEIDKILYLNNFNYNLDFFKLFFNFENQIYKNNFMNKFQSKFYNRNNKDLLSWPETIALNNLPNYFFQTNEEEYNILKKKYYDRLNSSYDFVYYKIQAYMTLCSNWWVINDRWSKVTVNHSEYSLNKDFERPEFIFFGDMYKFGEVIPLQFDSNGKINNERYLEWGSFHESLTTYSSDYNFFFGYVDKEIKIN